MPWLGLGRGRGERARARVRARVAKMPLDFILGQIQPQMWESDTEDAVWDKRDRRGCFRDAFKVTWSKETFFRENRVFLVQNGPKWSQNGPKGGPLGAPEGQFWVFEAPRPFGGS